MGVAEGRRSVVTTPVTARKKKVVALTVIGVITLIAIAHGSNSSTSTQSTTPQIKAPIIAPKHPWEGCDREIVIFRQDISDGLGAYTEFLKHLFSSDRDEVLRVAETAFNKRIEDAREYLKHSECKVRNEQMMNLIHSTAEEELK